MDFTLFQIILIVNVFILGAVVTFALQHAYAHFKPKQKSNQQRSTQSAHLSPELKERMLKMAEANFTGIVNRSALQLQHDLGATGTQLNKLLEKFGSEILEDEMKLFRANVDDIRKQTEATIGGSQNDIALKQAEVIATISKQQTDFATNIANKQAALETMLAEDIAAEKARFTAQLDTKLTDAVNAFLIETLGKNIDLGNQTDYLVTMLEEHKDNLIKGVIDEA